MKLKKVQKNTQDKAEFHLIEKAADLAKSGLKKETQADLKKKLSSNPGMYLTTENARFIFVCHCPKGSKTAEDKEVIRNFGHQAYAWCQKEKIGKALLNQTRSNSDVSSYFVEGWSLSDYSFQKYLSKKSKSAVDQLAVLDAGISKKDLDRIDNLSAAVFWSRDMVNEPLSFLTAERFAEEMRSMGKNVGLKVDVFGKEKIKTLKMGGLLAVNKGSIDPPTFTILEWKPANAKNKKPIVLVGKGVVYDTGGMSLKPTANSMDFMKSDMAGAAAMGGTMMALASLKIPAHVIALIPASDNRPGGNAYVPGDIITMFDGTTVEVMNTDAEGRLLLADALAYAKKYAPQLVIDAATLTGAAVRSIGTFATAAMGTASKRDLERLKKSGDATFERIVEFPLWDVYGDEMKSSIADLNNLGGPFAGQITAGKFLQHFTSYPWIHLDIAGPSYLHKPNTYRPKGGTGVGVRLLTDFIEKTIES